MSNLPILEFEVPYEPVFTNKMYRAVSAKSSKRNSGYWAVMARTDALKNYQYLMKTELPKLIPEDKLKLFVDTYNTGKYDIQVESVHYFNYKRFYEVDVSNLIKSYEDCIVKFIGIDDSRTTRYIVEKIPTDRNDWIIKTTMKLVIKHPAF